jgi:Na+/phosphate symporter
LTPQKRTPARTISSPGYRPPLTWTIIGFSLVFVVLVSILGVISGPAKAEAMQTVSPLTAVSENFSILFRFFVAFLLFIIPSLVFLPQLQWFFGWYVPTQRRQFKETGRLLEFNWWDSLPVVIAVVLALIEGMNEFYYKNSLFGSTINQLQALAWGFSTSTVVQAVFSALQRSPDALNNILKQVGSGK